MLKIGRINELRVERIRSVGAFLTSDVQNVEMLLPTKEMPDPCAEGDVLEVFVYRDSEDRLIATTSTPYAMAGEFAALKVKGKTDFGAFLDWGLPKDLLLPFREQKKPLEIGQRVVVYVRLDHETHRLVASARLNRHLSEFPPEYDVGQEVDLMVERKSDLGFNAIINGAHMGLIYSSEVPNGLEIGQKLTGYINEIREDDKIDLVLQKPGYGHVEDSLGGILKLLEDSEGFLPLHDKSSPEEIKKLLGVSKKTFKKAIGALYKQRKIDIRREGIHLRLDS